MTEMGTMKRGRVKRDRTVLADTLEVWPQLDPFAATVRWQLLQLGRIVQQSVDRVAATNGLTHSEVAVLGALKRFGPPFTASPSRIQHGHWVSLPGLGKSIDRLAAKGYVTRAINPDDRRAVLVTLTDAGNRCITDIIVNQAPPEYHALAELDDDRRAQLETLLPELLEILQAAVPLAGDQGEGGATT